MNPERYHLTLTSGDRTVMHGWWGDRAVADGKFTRWIGEHSSIDRARITLVDEQGDTVLTTWPDASDA